MMIFMVTITWTWWVNRNGILITDMESGPEKRNRIIHILKNISIFGGLNLVQNMARYDEGNELQLSGNKLKVSRLQAFVTSLRVWTFPATVMPILVTLVVLRNRLGLHNVENSNSATGAEIIAVVV